MLRCNTVSLTESDNHQQGVALYSKTPMGMALRAKHGFAKVLVDKTSRKVLGFHVIGSDASKLVHEVIPVITMTKGWMPSAAPRRKTTAMRK